MDLVSTETIQRIWTITLVVYVVVVAIVAILLTLILRAALDVRAAVSEIWTVGQHVASNTIHIALLHTTTSIAGAIVDCAKGVGAGSAALTAHAERCPECPTCVTDHGNP